jgi:hypothetical protein
MERATVVKVALLTPLFAGVAVAIALRTDWSGQ